MSDGKIEIETSIDTDGLNKGVKEVGNSLNKLKSAVSSIQGASIISAEIKALKALTNEIKNTAQAYNTQLKAETLLKTSATNNPYLNGEAVKNLEAFASTLQETSTYGDEQLIPMMANLANSGRTQAEIMDIMQASVDIASTGIVSLESAVQGLNMSYEGSIGQLGRAIPQLKNLTSEQLKNGDAVKFAKNQYSGMADAVASATGSYEQMKNAQGDFAEAWGKITKPTSDAWNNFWKGWYEQGKARAERLNEFLENISSKLIGKQLSVSVTANLKKIPESEWVVETARELRTLSAGEVDSIEKYLEGLKKRTSAQEEIYSRAKALNESRKLQEEEIAKLREEETKKAEEAKKTEEARQKAIDSTNKAYQALESDIDKYSAKAVEESEATLTALKEQLQALLDSGNLTEEQLAKVKDAITGIDTAIEELRASKIADTFNTIASVTDTVANNVSRLQSTITKLNETLQDSYDSEQASELDKLNDQYKEGLISYEDYVQGKEKLDKEYAEKKYQLQMAEWTMQLATATANIAQGVSAALAGTPPASYINASATALLGAGEIATILSNKPKKGFASGGIVGATAGADNTYGVVGLRNGEMVLNAQQQKELWSVANGASGGNAIVNLPINIENNANTNVNASISDSQIKITIDEIVNTSLRQGIYDSSLNQQKANMNGRTIL